MSILHRVEGELESLVSAGSLGIGLVAAIGSMALQGADGKAALKFGAITILGAAIGNVVLSWAGIDKRIEDRYGGKVLDPTDFVSAAASVTLLSIYLGLRGEPLWRTTAIAGFAGGVGHAVGGKLFHFGGAKRPGGPVYAPGPVSSGPEKHRPGGPVIHQGGPVYAPGPMRSGPIYSTGPIMSKMGSSIILP